MNRIVKNYEVNFANIYIVERYPSTYIKDIIKEPNIVLFDKINKEQYLKEIYIQLPYYNEKIKISYIKSRFFSVAKKYGLQNSLDKQRQTAFLLREKNNIIIKTANGSDYHNNHECRRRKLNVPTGTRYDLCEGCSPKNHAESKAGLQLLNTGFKFNPKLHKAYLWGHWWPCEFCVENMLKIGIPRLYLSKAWTRNFLKIEQL